MKQVKLAGSVLALVTMLLAAGPASAAAKVFSGPGTGISVIASGTLINDNVVTGANLGALVLAASTTLRHNTFAANGGGVLVVADAIGTVVTSNNFLGGGAGSFGFNCGLSTEIPGQNAANNSWGSATGPGLERADQVCLSGTVTTPFLKAPAFVNATGGR